MDNALTGLRNYPNYLGGMNFNPNYQPIQQPEEPKPEPKKEAPKPKPKRVHKESQKVIRLDGRPLDLPLVRAVSDYLGLDQETMQLDEKILGELVLLAAQKVNSTDEYKIMRYIKKALRQNHEGWGNRNPHRYLYRLLRM